jgi:hypothetical protein
MTSMNTGQTRIRRTAADLEPARIGASRHGRSIHRRIAGASDLAPHEEASFTFLSRILTGDQTWSIGEVRRLLDLRERGLAGLAG